MLKKIKREKKTMNWLLILWSVLFALSFLFLMLYVILAILESTRQQMILIGTLASLFFLLLAMTQGRAIQQTPPQKKETA